MAQQTNLRALAPRWQDGAGTKLGAGSGTARARRARDPVGVGALIPGGVKAAAVLAAMALLLPGPAAAQGWIEPPVDRGLHTRIEKIRSRVRVRIDGPVARIEVDEWFRNTGSRPAEGDYLYPLPGEAAFGSFSLYQGEEELRGETMDAEQARAIYEDIVRRLKDPALIELAGHGLIRARVFPIAPGETRQVTLRYEQLLSRAGEALHFRYAAGVRTTGSPLLRPAGRTEHVRSGPASTVPIDFAMSVVDGADYLDPFSPTHPVEVERRGEELRVRPRDDLRGDLSLFLPFARDRVGLTVATHRVPGEEGYFLLTLSPGRVDARPEPRDVTVVLDVSGSMSGEKMEQARAALDALLGTLSNRDRFRLVAFSNAARPYRLEWTEVTRATVEEARDWVARLDANGGTNVAAALDEAFRLDTPTDRLPLVIFLTDGIPSVGEEDPHRIAARAEERRGRSRVFAFGVGYDVNTALLDGLTAAARGSTEYIEPGESVERAIGLLSSKIRHPVLTDLAIVRAPAGLSEVYPVTIPDLFAGEDLVLFGRYETGSEGAEGEVVVRGRRAGQSEEYSVRATFPARSDDNAFLPRLWASRKLGFLSRSVALEGPNPEIVEEIRRTALRYGLLSEYTAYLVQEPLGFVADREAEDRLPMPRRPVAGRFEAPAAQSLAAAGGSGEAAVRLAEKARLRRQVSSAAELEELDRASAESMAPAEGAANARTVAGRLFVERDGVWTDQTRPRTEEVLEVALYSAAYFDLLAALPELRPVGQTLHRFEVAGARMILRIADEGIETIAPERLAVVVREFRES